MADKNFLLTDEDFIGGDPMKILNVKNSTYK